MFRTTDGKVYRNLESQVEFLTQQVAAHWNVDRIIAEFGIRVVGSADNPEEIPNAATYTGEYGDTYLVGYNAPYDAYIFTRPFEGQDEPQWFNIGQLTIQGAAGLPGRRGSYWFTGTTAPVGIEMSGTQVLTYDMYLNTTNGNVYQYDGSNWVLAGNIKGPAGSGGGGGGAATGAIKYEWINIHEVTEAQKENAIFLSTSLSVPISFESGNNEDLYLSNMAFARDPSSGELSFVCNDVIQRLSNNDNKLIIVDNLQLYLIGETDWYIDGIVKRLVNDGYDYGFFDSDVQLTSTYFLTTTA